MSKLKLMLPDESWREAVMEFKKEYQDAGSAMDGTAGLASRDFDEWLEQVIRNRSKETVAPGLVPATTYLSVREEDGKLIGMIDIRHYLNDFLRQHGGHIGYSIRPGERRKGYAKEQLALALEKCKELGIDKALVTCDKNNPGSAKTILANGGVLENEIPDGERITQRYWIDIEPSGELKLVLPEEISRDVFESFKQEFLDHGVIEGVGLMLEQDFDTWQKQAIDYRYEENLPEGWVPATTYLTIRKADGKLIGRIDLRHRLTEHLLNFGGHIGYAIRPSEQRKGYGKEQLRLVLAECKKLGIDRALITCSKLNTASAKTILACGGVLENEWDNGGRITQRYWIDVK